jgi:hypothetical protein
MRLISFALALFVLALPAGAQKPTEAEQRPESLLEELGLAPNPERLREAIAAAEAHPLGSRENPVRVGGPRGERAYIARLRCADGSSPRVGQRANIGVGVFGTIVDLYPLDCGTAAPGQVSLVMDMYHSDHAENRAPPGFTLVEP